MKSKLSIHRDFRIAPVDDRVYGAFLEHLGRAVYTGIYEPGHRTADESGFRGDVIELVRELNPPVVRYPGGNFVSAYNWEDGVGPRDERPVRLDLAWRSRETNEIGTNEFADWAKLANTEMMLAVNLGSRDLDGARNFLEYCNHPGGTYWSDLRAKHGYRDPHDVKLWCLGNEMDGPWQVGHKTAREYGEVANETSKAFKYYDASIQTVVCGSSHDRMATYPEWEATVLEECFDSVDYISLHRYFDNFENDTPNYLAKTISLDRYIRTVSGVIDYVKAKNRSKNDVFISFDEWNVWYHERENDAKRVKEWDWPVAPPLLEDAYNFEDALLVAGIINVFLRHADRVKIACIAQLVNVIAPIMTATGGPAWRQSIFHPLQIASRLGRGISLNVVTDSPTYDCDEADDVPYADVSAVASADGATVTIFAVNRHMSEPMEIDASLIGFGELAITEHLALADCDPKTANSAQHPDAVRPKRGSGLAIVDGDRLVGALPAFSYAAITCRAITT